MTFVYVYMINIDTKEKKLNIDQLQQVTGGNESNDDIGLGSLVEAPNNNPDPIIVKLHLDKTKTQFPIRFNPVEIGFFVLWTILVFVYYFCFSQANFRSSNSSVMFSTEISSTFSSFLAKSLIDVK